MKRFFVFTLTILCLTTCLLAVNVFAYDSDTEEGNGFAGNAWGSACVLTKFVYPYAQSGHGFYLYNMSDVAMRYYYDFDVSVSDGPSLIPPKGDDDDGWVDRNDAVGIGDEFLFNMTFKKEGNYVINASTTLNVKADFNQDGIFESYHDWEASCSTVFTLE